MYIFVLVALCQQLLDYEPRAGDQVPLLMSMGQDELALVKAIESGDTDLGNEITFFFICLLVRFFLFQHEN